MTDRNTQVDQSPRVACVTGATGMLGSRIVKGLKDLGFSVRVLTRSSIDMLNVQVYRGSLADEAVLSEFINGADMLFHCAAELSDESRMHETNVAGTSRLIALARKHKVRYFCHISSAGVIGRTTQSLVDEDTPCWPQNTYEKSKYAAEKMFAAGIDGCKVVILRPTNVVDKRHVADLRLPLDGSFISRLKAIVKGGECAHLVHADDVASAALHFIDRPVLTSPRIYIVSIDADPKNTVADLWGMCKGALAGNVGGAKSHWHLPVYVPYLIRNVVGRAANRGDVRYSSHRITAEDFKFAFEVEDIVRDIAFSWDK